MKILHFLNLLFFAFNILYIQPIFSDELTENSPDDALQIFNDDATQNEPELKINSFSSLNHIGLGLSMTNNGVTNGLYNLTEDTLLKDVVSEKIWGIGLIFDLGWDEESISSLRTKWQWGRDRIQIPPATRAEHPADSLEEMLNLFMLDFVIRTKPKAFDFGFPLWVGAGFSIHYAISSSTGGAGSDRKSRLKNSTSLSPLLSFGSDIPLDDGQEVILEADWLIFKAYQFTLGFRTRI